MRDCQRIQCRAFQQPFDAIWEIRFDPYLPLQRPGECLAPDRLAERFPGGRDPYAPTRKLALGHSRHLLQRVLDAELAALGIEFGFDAVEIIARARLQLVGSILVEALDRCDLLLVDIGELLDRSETFRRQQLANYLVDI